MDLSYALKRIQTASRYGADMRSSRDLCVADAIDLISDSLNSGELPAAAKEHAMCARAILQQAAHFDADLRYAVMNLNTAIRITRTCPDCSQAFDAVWIMQAHRTGCRRSS